MYKSMSFFRYNPALTVAECEEHYREVHTPLVIEQVCHTPGFRAYVQNRVLSARKHSFNSPEATPMTPEFDRVVELYWDRVPDLGAGGGRAFADHRNFMDVDAPVSMTVYEVEEVVAHGRAIPGL